MHFLCLSLLLGMVTFFVWDPKSKRLVGANTFTISRFSLSMSSITFVFLLLGLMFSLSRLNCWLYPKWNSFSYILCCCFLKFVVCVYFGRSGQAERKGKCWCWSLFEDTKTSMRLICYRYLIYCDFRKVFKCGNGLKGQLRSRLWWSLWMELACWIQRQNLLNKQIPFWFSDV